MTNPSFRYVSNEMCRHCPPDSLWKLANTHRWIGDSPPFPISLRTIIERHTDPSTVKQKFLSYNTFLLEAFDIPLGQLIRNLWAPEKLLKHLGIDVRNALAKALEMMNQEDLCDRYFPPIVSVSEISVNPLNNACKIAETSVNFVEWLIEKLSLTPMAFLSDLGFDILTILSWFGINIPENIHIAGKPALEDRGVEIGRAIATDYHVAALCEVWKDGSRTRLLSAITTSGSIVQSVMGPDASGLLVVSLDHQLVGKANMVFQNTGVHRHMLGVDLGRFVDADQWVSKGVLLTLLDLGVGFIEIYNLHLYSGGDLEIIADILNMAGIPVEKVQPDERDEIRNLQVTEFVEFFRNNHNSRNVAILCGDFNINAFEFLNPGDSRPEWLTALNAIGMEDWAVKGCDQGGTHGKESDTSDRFDGMCDTVPGSPYCTATTTPPSDNEKKRIDYLFIEKPTCEHSFNLDVSCVCRRPFPRISPTENQYFLSDHLGLEVTLIASRRVC